jgi:hypothetical protein
MFSKNLFFIFFIFFIFTVNAATLTISPPQINFQGNVGEKICKEIEIKVNGTENLTGKIKWAKEGYFEKVLSEHNLESKELKLEVNFPKNLEIKENEKIEICLKGKKTGKYHGVLLYRIKNKPLQIGIWVNVNLEGKDFIKMTGNFVKTENEFNSMLIFPTILLVVFIILIFWYKKKIS